MTENATRSRDEGLDEVDVLVVGYGAAGAAAALAAHDAGARVLVLEKCAQPGGNSLVSSANTVYPKHPDDVERFCRYLTEVCDGTTPTEVIEAYVQGLVGLPAWLESMGGDLEDLDGPLMGPLSSYYIPNLTFPQLPGAQGLSVFDEENVTRGPIGISMFSYNVVKLGYEWSEDNSVEIDRGWIVRAVTLTELAEKLEIPAQALARTVQVYNNGCRAGHDVDFGRCPESLKPLQPPYHALRLVPLLYNTQGGPCRDTRARVLDIDGQPVPGLYAAGELGSIWGSRYQTSTNFGEALVFGRIAGHTAAS